MLISFEPEPVFPPTITITEPEEDLTTCATVMLVKGKVSDVQGVDKVEVVLDGDDPVMANIDGDDWSYEFMNLTVMKHTVKATAYNDVGLTAAAYVNWTQIDSDTKAYIADGGWV